MMTYSYSLLKEVEKFLNIAVHSLLPPVPAPIATVNPTRRTRQDIESSNMSRILGSSSLSNSQNNATTDHDIILIQTKEQIQSCRILPNIDEIINFLSSTLHTSTNINDTKSCINAIQDYFQTMESLLKNDTSRAHHEYSNDNIVDDDLLLQLNVIAMPIFEKIEQHILQLNANVPQWKSLLLQYLYLHNAKKKCKAFHIQSYMMKGCVEEGEKIIMKPKDLNIIHEFLLAGEPKHGDYASSFDLYQTIIQSYPKALSGVLSRNIFFRLAIAIALEFDQPLSIFDNQKSFINPIQRYHHYEKAFCDGELDECFPTLSTWELRMVVNNDAHDDEIQWCRNMLRNYRPDHILGLNDNHHSSNIMDYQWKYCKIVKTDVRYKVPDWKQYPKTYKQLLSGGGKCGPRAWFGRFVCKSFGIPTWGVRQPGHAAMSHWMPQSATGTHKGWAICLGGPNWTKSHWEGKKGIHFQWETKARRAFPLSFQDFIIWLRCFEIIERTSNHDNVKGNFWQLLQLLKMRQLFCMEKNVQDNTYFSSSDEIRVVTCTQRIKEMYVEDTDVVNESNDDIIFQASSCFNSKDPSNDFIVSKSFHGGYQVHLKGNAFLKYHINVPMKVYSDSKGSRHFVKYHLSCRIVTVHAEITPLILRVASNIHENIHEIKINYTEGEWQSTDPIEVELLEGKQNLLHFYRDDEMSLGLTIKDFTLKRLD